MASPKRPMNYISRIDVEHLDSTRGNQHCWFVRILANKPERITASFSDSYYGGDKRQSLIAAQDFRDRQLKKYNALIAQYQRKAIAGNKMPRPWSKEKYQQCRIKNRCRYYSVRKRKRKSGKISRYYQARVLHPHHWIAQQLVKE